MRYIDKIETDAPTEPNNALVLGTAVHTGIEKSLEEAIGQYCFAYPIITDEHINEIIKLQNIIPKAKEAIPKGGKFEVEIKDNDFIGFIDYLVPIEEAGVFDIYDFKYTGNPRNYEDSAQLHLYKYFFEKCNQGCKIRNMYFVFIPKLQIRQNKNESLSTFRSRLENELSKLKVKIVQQEFNYNKVIEFLLNIKKVKEETEFTKYISFLCKFCEFQEYCEKGNDYFMRLPENKRRTIEAATKRVIWIYGAPFCGKTTFANGFPDPLMINTDGNIKFVDAPYIRIKDEISVVGRQTKRILAWENFKDTIAELEKQENTFKTIVVDLLEDLYEHCRLYMYGQMGITHESDDSFRAWDKVRSEFLNTLKRLMNLDYENIILISHEDTSRDLTRKGGDKISSIKPNLQDKVAVKVAGMVDVVARIVADGDVHTFCFKSNEVVFGGGRLKVTAKDIPLDVNALFAVYDEANGKTINYSAENEKPAETANTAKSRRKKATAEPEEQPKEDELERATEDLYAIHTESNSGMIIKQGEILPLNDGIKFVTKEEYDAFVSESEEPTAELSEDEAPWNDSEQTDASTVEEPEEKPRRRRKAR